MNRIIKACEVLDLQVLQIQYNDSEEKEAAVTPANPKWSLHTKYLALSGMTCAACVQTIEKALLSVDGVQRCSVSLPLQRATVLYNHSRVGVELLNKKIEGVGYGARLYERTAEQNVELLQRDEELKSLRISFTSALFVASLIAGIDGLRFLTLSQPGLMDAVAVSINLGLASWVQFRDAAFIHESAWAQGMKGLATMDTLLSLSLLLAYLLSIFNIFVNGFAEGQTYLTSSSSLAVVLIGGRYVHVLMSRSNAGFLVKLFRLQVESATVMVKSSRVSSSLLYSVL
jgi:Cu+-exporting ATPase